MIGGRSDNPPELTTVYPQSGIKNFPIRDYSSEEYRPLVHPEAVFLNFYGAQKSFQWINSASLCSLAGRYKNPIPIWFLAPIDSSKIPALKYKVCKVWNSVERERKSCDYVSHMSCRTSDHILLLERHRCWSTDKVRYRYRCSCIDTYCTYCCADKDVIIWS